MRTARRVIRISRDPSTVFDQVADPSTYPHFFVGLHGWDPVEGDGRKVGDRLRILLEIGSTHAGGIVRITDVDPAERFAWESEVGTRHDAAFELRPVDEGTEVTLAITFRLAGGLTGRVTEQVATPIVTRMLDATLEALRHRVEWQHLRPDA